MRPATPEEYDAAVRRCPDLCPLVLVGDRRTGAQVESPVTGGSRPTASHRCSCRDCTTDLARHGRLRRIRALITLVLTQLRAPSPSAARRPRTNRFCYRFESR